MPSIRPIHFREGRPARNWDTCHICGADCRSTRSNPFPKHDSAVHEVWALEKYGMHAVAYWARPFVQEWASTGQLPTREEIDVIRAEWVARNPLK